MAEHTPAPIPARGVYGFAIFLFFKTLFIIYVFWAFVPLSFLEDVLGLTYLPNKYFAMFVPVLILVAANLFAFCIYPALGLTLTLNTNDSRTIQDQFSIRRCKFKAKCDNIIDSNGTWQYDDFCTTHNRASTNVPITEHKISNYCDCIDKENCLLNSSKTDYLKELKNRKPVDKVSDLDISDVCKMLYLKDE